MRISTDVDAWLIDEGHSGFLKSLYRFRERLEEAVNAAEANSVHADSAIC